MSRDQLQVMRERAMASDIVPPSILYFAFFQALAQHFRALRTYDPSNMLFEKMSQEIVRVASIVRQQDEAQRMKLSFRNEKIFLNDVLIKPRARYLELYEFLIAYFKRRKCGGLEFVDIPREDEVRKFMLWMQESENEKDCVQFVRDQLNSKAIQTIRIEYGFGHEKEGEDGESGKEKKVALVYKHLHQFVETCFENFDKTEMFALDSIDPLIREMTFLAQDELIQMLRLVSMKRYDRPLPYQAVNSAFLLSCWARGLRLPGIVVRELAGAALLHPLGLFAEPDYSFENAPKDETRFEVYDRLSRLKRVWPHSAVQRLAAVEWMYPYGDRGVYRIGGLECYEHFFSRMVRIVACFEFWTTFSEGRSSMLPDEALSKMLQNPRQFDPSLLKLFVNWLGIYPVGSLVLLNTGEIAQVFAGASDPLRFTRPIVTIVKDNGGEILKRPRLIDLMEVNDDIGVYKRTIRRSISIDEAQVPLEVFQLTPIGFDSASGGN